MPVQTTYTTPAKAYPGLLADDGPHDIGSASVDAVGGIAPGLLVMRTANGDYAADVPPAVAADVDSLKTNIGSTTGVQNFVAADLNGAVGAGLISPPAKVTLALSSHADWDATNATLTGFDHNGMPVSETLAIPNGGNATVTSQNHYSRLAPTGTALSIPAQAGTGGTATLGTAADVSLEGADVLGVSVREHKGRLVPSETNNEIWDDGDEMPILRRGRIYVQMENAFRAGECPMVRVVAAGAEQRGRFLGSGSTDGGDAVPFRRARTINSGSAGEFAVLQVFLG